MTALPILKPKEVIRALQRAGFYIHHQTGSAEISKDEFLKFL
jgi:predicted RNA binding protein YcfA (HicA-like mRNA interferase family)